MYQVSILVPIYGVEKYIERCARSLFEQTYDNLEYIFVDDCSPDKSMEILEQVMEDYPNRKKQVRIIRHEHNRGLAAARNTALDATTSLFITHVDSDDYLSPDAIHLLVNKQVETGADIVSGNYYVIESNRIKKAYEPDYVDQHDMMRKVFSSRMGIKSIWNRLIRLSLYKNHHVKAMEGVNYGEDWLQTVLLTYYAKNVAKINDHIYYYDRTNIDSYVSKIPHDTELWNQSLKTAFIVDHFFSDREPECQELAHRAVTNTLKVRMSMAAKYRNKVFFEDMKHIITTKYTKYYDEIGWNNPLVRVFMCNYTLNGVYRRSYAYFQQIVAFLRVKYLYFCSLEKCCVKLILTLLIYSVFHNSITNTEFYQ